MATRRGVSHGLGLLGVGLVLTAIAGPARADCPSRITIARGDTLSAIATTCGLDLERLRMANPGIVAGSLQPGAILAIPTPGLPTPQRPLGPQRIPIAPPIATRPAPSELPTAILPPRPLPQRPLYVDPTRQPLPGQLPAPGQPGSPGFPLPLR